MEGFGYEKLDVWHKAMELVDAVYEATGDYPQQESFGLTAQMQGASVSVPSNIAEGYGLGSKQFRNHLRIARGSLFELRTQVDVSLRQRFLTEAHATSLKSQAVEVSKMVEGLLRSLGP